MHVLCGKTNGLRLIYHDFREFTREEWRGLVVGDDFRVVRVGMIESKSADW